MRPLKLYLETSVWNFFFADDAPEKKEVTETFFSNLEISGFRIYASVVVVEEIERASEQRRNDLLKLIASHRPEILAIDPPVTDLATSYLRHGVLPESALLDAYHIAFASVHELDYLVSWNLRHIANVRRQEMAQAINLLNGYTKTIRLITPMEVSEYERADD